MEAVAAVETLRQALLMLNQAVDAISARIPEPVCVEEGEKTRLRHLQQDSDLLKRLKALRVLSGINAALLLHVEGFFQESAALLRVVRQCLDDILFMISGETSADPGKEYTEFMRSFYQHRLPSVDDVLAGRISKQPFIPRRKINAAVARLLKVPDPSTFNAVRAAEDIALDGYVHPAYEQVMEMFSIDGQGFETAGSTNRMHARTALGYLANTIVFALDVCAVIAAQDQQNHLVEALLGHANLLKGHTTMDL